MRTYAHFKVTGNQIREERNVMERNIHKAHFETLDKHIFASVRLVTKRQDILQKETLRGSRVPKYPYRHLRTRRTRQSDTAILNERSKSLTNILVFPRRRTCRNTKAHVRASMG